MHATFVMLAALTTVHHRHHTNVLTWVKLCIALHKRCSAAGHCAAVHHQQHRRPKPLGNLQAMAHMAGVCNGLAGWNWFFQVHTVQTVCRVPPSGLIMCINSQMQGPHITALHGSPMVGLSRFRDM
jgi:hypothetical protein